MNNHSKQDVVTALSKLPTDVLVQLMHLYQESNREKLKKSDAESVFIISNIPEKVQEEVKRNAWQKIGFIFEKVLYFLSLLWYVVVLKGGTTHEKYDKRTVARKHHSARGQQK